jgi:phosphatidylinositol-4,5-bisphosphate 3-kinase catalytic subunit alpha/beta/delta
MLATGLPQLRSEEDLDYLKSAFHLDLSEQQAATKFSELILESLNTKSTQLNFAVHILANPK